jgi:chorismate-pyruvate lyase
MAQVPRIAIFSGIAFVVVATAAPTLAETPTWSDDFLTRVEAQALVQTLNSEFLATRSATLTLEKWCGTHQLAGGVSTIKAHLIRGENKPATAEQRERLKVGPDEMVNYRHVQLVCGDRVLSEADNWYVPARLTLQMNRLLETTDTPFGKAVLDLHFYRQTFAANVLWLPLPEGWEMKSSTVFGKGGILAIPQALFEHRALLFTKNGVPFSEVRETYQRALLDFPLPHP